MQRNPGESFGDYQVRRKAQNALDNMKLKGAMVIDGKLIFPDMIRELKKRVPHDVKILVAAIAEHAEVEYDALSLELFYALSPECRRKEIVDGLREIYNELQADHEEDEEDE